MDKPRVRSTSFKDAVPLNRERGSVMVVAVVSLAGLLTLGSYAVVMVQRGTRAAAHERFESAALFAAESGITVGMEWLAENVVPTTNWSDHVAAGAVETPMTNAWGQDVHAGQTGSMFTGDLPLRYHLELRNNSDDTGFATGDDTDGIVVLRSTGFGPDNSTVVLEVEVAAADITSSGGRPCPGYAQKGIMEDGAGRNDCLGAVDGNDVVATSPFSP